jgi:hypothetical protein
MSASRRRNCGAQDARVRCRQAVAYLETAELITSDGSLPADYDYSHVAAGVAVLAAIAASDALCCRLLGERSRGQDHREAVDLLATVRFGEGGPPAQAKRATSSPPPWQQCSTSRTKPTTGPRCSASTGPTADQGRRQTRESGCRSWATLINHLEQRRSVKRAIGFSPPPV